MSDIRSEGGIGNTVLLLSGIIFNLYKKTVLYVEIEISFPFVLGKAIGKSLTLPAKRNEWILPD